MKRGCYNEGEERWSQLPVLLVWMIKDRLNFRDNTRFACVCKNWESASLSYTDDKSKPHPLPWLIQQRYDKPAYDFINVFTKDKFTLERPEFHQANRFLFSLGGWMLHIRSYILTYEEPPAGYFILFNPGTNAKIIIPQPRDGCFISASFSLSGDGNPEYIALCYDDSGSDKDKFATLYIASAADKRWAKHSYQDELGRKINIIGQLLIHGSKVYNLDLEGVFSIFDMAGKLPSWKTFNTSGVKKIPRNIRWRIMECQGQIVKVDQGENLKTFSFFWWDDMKTSWEELDEEDNDMCWFFGHTNNNFCVKGGSGMKKKVCFVRDYSNKKSLLEIHDLISGGAPGYVETEQPDGLWVDLGRMSKLPPSCVEYVVMPELEVKTLFQVLSGKLTSCQ